MNCPKCNRENEEGAMYCRYCGSLMNSVVEKESDTSSLLLLIWIIANFISYIFSYAYTHLVESWYDGAAKICLIAVQSIFVILNILPALAIKNRTYRIIGIIIMSCIIIWWLYQNICWAMKSI